MNLKLLVEALESLGWQFLPIGPNEWEWRKFDQNGKVTAIQGDEQWAKDMSDLTKVEDDA